MKKIIIKVLVLIAIIFILLLIIGLIFTPRKREDVVLGDYKVSSDGRIMTLKVGVASSAGYIGSMQEQIKDNAYYLTFFKTFGINSKIGAGDTFEIELNNDIEEVYIYSNNKEYKLILIKDSVTNEWIKIKYSSNNIIKLELPLKKEIEKVELYTYSQDNNYFSYSDNDTIDKIYNILNNLETTIISKTYNPEDPDEMYRVNFLYNNDNIVDVDIYKKNNKYYVEQRYNGIYEITREDFNLIKSYIK